MNLFIIIIMAAVFITIMLLYSARNAHEIKENPFNKTIHEVRKITYVTDIENEKPKKRVYKKRTVIDKKSIVKPKKIIK